MGPLTTYQLLRDPIFFNEVSLDQKQFGHLLLTDTFLNFPFSTCLKISGADKSLCAQGRIATSLKGNLKPIFIKLFENAIRPFHTHIEVTSASPMTTVFNDDESSYTIYAHNNLHIKRGYLWLELSLNQIKRNILEGRTLILPKLYPKQVIWFRDLNHDFLTDLDTLEDEDKMFKLSEAINRMMPSSHRFIIKSAEDETRISPQMTNNSMDGVKVISERVMKIKIVSNDTSQHQVV